MRVILAQPRGFCAGVVRAIDTVEHALRRLAEVELLTLPGREEHVMFRLLAELAADAAEVTAP